MYVKQPACLGGGLDDELTRIHTSVPSRSVSTRIGSKTRGGRNFGRAKYFLCALRWRTSRDKELRPTRRTTAFMILSAESPRNSRHSTKTRSLSDRVEITRQCRNPGFVLQQFFSRANCEDTGKCIQKGRISTLPSYRTRRRSCALPLLVTLAKMRTRCHSTVLHDRQVHPGDTPVYCCSAGGRPTLAFTVLTCEDGSG